MGLERSQDLFIVGIALIPFIALVLYTARLVQPNKPLIMLIVIQDWIWVIGSAVLIIFNPFQITTIGLILIAAVAMFVAMFAILQQRTLNHQS